MTDLRHFKYFLAVTEHGGFSSAARALNVSQPSVSMAVKTLEEEVGTALLERGPKGVNVTAAGQVFARRIRSTLRESERAFEDARHLTGLSGGAVTIGMSAVLSTFLGNKALIEFHRRHPGVKVDIRVSTHNVEEINQAIDGALWDFGLVLLNSELNSFSNLKIEPVLEFSSSIYVASDHPLAGCSDVSLNECAEFDWLLSIFTTPTWLFAAFDKQKIKHPQVSMVTNSFDLIRELACGSSFLCVMPDPFAQPALDFGRMVRIEQKSFSIKSSIGIAYPAQGMLTTAAQTLIGVIRETAAKI
ncbi:MAG: LysR family transcriptional regulator [Rhodospirillaceae bacterium]